MVVVVSSDGSSGTSSQYQIQNKLGGFWHNLQIPTKYLCRAEKWGQIQHFIGERNDIYTSFNLGGNMSNVLLT